MKPLDFLRTILPATGHYALVGIKNKKVKQVLIDDLSKAGGIIKAALNAGEDVYFGCSSFTAPDNRKIENVQHTKAFWVDLDCGEGTPYETKADGFAALRSAVRSTGLPKPYVVDSGRGLHVYWPLETPILAEVWKVYSVKLVELLTAHELFIKDKGCSTDAARILRVPNTYNYKNPDEPMLTSILLEGATTPFEDLKELIQAKCGEKGINGFHPKKPKAKRQKVDPLTAALAGNSISVFKTIAKKSLKGEGCEQIRNALENPAATSEPLWRAVLSIAQVCEDRDIAIHKISQGHAGYDHQQTEDKANGTNGPLTCEGFKTTCGSGLCSGCTWGNGRIIGPIALGRAIAKAPKETHLMFVDQDGNKIESPVLSADIAIPDLPFPYFRGIKGGIYQHAPKAPEGAEQLPDTLIYEHSLDVIRRVKDPEKGEVLVMLHTRPKDGMEEIVISLSDAQAMDRLKDKLSYHGVAAHKEGMTKIGTYITKVVKNMNFEAAAEPARSQMGWTEDRQGFVWGRKIFTKDGAKYCPPAAKSTQVAGLMRSAGSFKEWEEVVERYAEPGFELYAMALFLAFGSILNNYTYEDPLWIHLVSSGSGTGKTTLTKVINSIWGDPMGMMFTVKDTINALEKRRVVFNSIAICQDEITNLPPEKISDLAYAQSQGREKLRLSQSSTEIINSDRRSNHFFSNGNKHIRDILSAFKANAAGEYMRMLELEFQPLGDKKIGDEHFGKILSNFGHAGPMYAQWAVQHEHELNALVTGERHRFEDIFTSEISERNWAAATATGLAAAHILQKELGIMQAFDMERIEAVWVSTLLSMRASALENTVTHDNILGDFINENYANILIPDEKATQAAAASPQTASLYGAKNERESRNKLVIRWEKQSRNLFIAHSEFKAYCAKRSHSFIDLLAYYNKMNDFRLVTKRMGTGSVMTSPVKVLLFHIPIGSELGILIEEDDGHPVP